MKLTLNDWKDVNFKQLGSAPLAIRLFALILTCISTLSIGIFLQIYPSYQQFNHAQQTEQTLKQNYQIKAAKASQIGQYQVQLETMRETLNTLLEQLPSETEIPQLIIDISQTALANGLIIKLFKPQDDTVLEFYAEKPIELIMQGNYHQFAMFASDIATLPRIVTLHDMHLMHDQEQGQMSMHAIAKTYRYLDAEYKIEIKS